MIIDHNDRRYRDKWNLMECNKYNGAFYYSKEIVANIIPNVKQIGAGSRSMSRELDAIDRKSVV